MRLYKYFLILLILFNILMASRWIADGNIFFHTDIARDFLLMEDIVDNKNLVLIGPRSGAIPGLFHGPLWLYLNLPAFLIGAGNPVFVGWFWVVLYVLSLGIIYFVGKKIFDKETGMLSVLLLSTTTIPYVKTLFNPYGALLLFPLYIYFFANYLHTKKIKKLLLAFFVLGLIIQFQMAFGVPIAILTVFYLIYVWYKNKHFLHSISFFVLIIPLSSHILFEIRNNFLQTKSVLAYLGGTQSHGKLDLNFFQLVGVRASEMVRDGLGILTQENMYITALFLAVLSLMFFKVLKEKSQTRLIYFLAAYFYLGFWALTVFFKGPVWNYYYIPFIPLLVFVFVSAKNILNKWMFYTLVILIYFVNIQAAFKDFLAYNPSPTEQDVSTWKFNQLVAQKVFEDKEDEFGYFIFTPDLYGYSPRYALNFYQKRHLAKKVYPYQKKAVTYLVIAPPPEYGSDPNSVWYKKNTNSSTWKSNDIRISKKPELTITFSNGFIIEKYSLSAEEIKVEPNPFLIKDIFFR